MANSGPRNHYNQSYIKDPLVRVTTKNIQSWTEYKEWLAVVKSRSDKCEKCGSGEDLHGHHKKPVKIIFAENNIVTNQDALNCKELWDTNNGMVVCRYCHLQEDENPKNLIPFHFKSKYEENKKQLRELLELDVPINAIRVMLGLGKNTIWRHKRKMEKEAPIIVHTNKEKIGVLLKQGYNTREIGKILGVAPTLVSYHRKSLNLD